MQKSYIKFIYETKGAFNREVKTDYILTHDFHYALQVFAANHSLQPYKLLQMTLVDEKLR